MGIATIRPIGSVARAGRRVQAARGTRRSRLASMAALALVGVLAGCASADVRLPEADLATIGTDRLTWEPDVLRMSAGTRSVGILCEPGANHNFVIEETGEEIAVCTPGRTGFGEVTLEAGTYVFFCSVPGHEVTMRGIIEVS
jgi:plastocyanin